MSGSVGGVTHHTDAICVVLGGTRGVGPCPGREIEGS